MRVQSLIRQVGKRVENYSTSSFSPCHFLKLQAPPSQTMSRPVYHYFQQLVRHKTLLIFSFLLFSFLLFKLPFNYCIRCFPYHKGISSSRNLLADLSAGVTPLSASDGEKGEERDRKSPSGPSQVQFVLKGINQVTIFHTCCIFLNNCFSLGYGCGCGWGCYTLKWAYVY